MKHGLWLCVLIAVATLTSPAEPDAQPEAGHVIARRLNRTEYNNTVRDLLGVDIDPANDFPQDDAIYGFDNIANALTVSPLLMEKYLAAAEKVAHTAVFGPEAKTATLRFYPPIPRRWESANPTRITEPAPYSMEDYDVTGLSQPGAFHFTYKFPAEGEYTFKMYSSTNRPKGSEAQMIDLWIDGKLAQSMVAPEVSTPTNERVPTPAIFKTKLTAGPHSFMAALPRQYDGLPASYRGPNPSSKPAPPGRGGGFGPPGGAPRVPKFDGVGISEFDIEGPLEAKTGPLPDSLQKVWVCQTRDAACEQKIISRLVPRAFRRPLSKTESDQFVKIASDARKRGRSFEQGLTLAIEAILVSPDFLFRIEPEPPDGETRQLNPFELAARLSYFLWSTMPDDELTRAAADGSLSKPAGLEAQVRRMMKDPKSRALAENFAGQWLELRRLE
ncbi:MAG: DUF1587 domain-containing protein, partial [Bryobacteraceae bacterium]